MTNYLVFYLLIPILSVSRRAAVNMADLCRIVIEAVLKYAQELLGSNTNLNLPADLKVCHVFRAQRRQRASNMGSVHLLSL